ncbi:hypothetical protein [Saprospira grandis]|uniref:hypothetical protein n=1 Tax=Saprospira grandis TaxID=1008 RepID=UPI0022DE5C5E|nr:hypothetical protein [Saprospira grandis]WBM74742.1 hypothetical protein OP864_00605 [Saprospira grandis]
MLRIAVWVVIVSLMFSCDPLDKVNGRLENIKLCHDFRKWTKGECNLVYIEFNLEIENLSSEEVSIELPFGKEKCIDNSPSIKSMALYVEDTSYFLISPTWERTTKIIKPYSKDSLSVIFMEEIMLPSSSLEGLSDYYSTYFSKKSRIDLQLNIGQVKKTMSIEIDENPIFEYWILKDKGDWTWEWESIQRDHPDFDYSPFRPPEIK